MNRYTAQPVGEPPRVLIVLYAAIGDVVMASFSVSALRELHPDAEIAWMVDERCKDVLDTDRLINHLYVTTRTRLKKEGKPVAAMLNPFRTALTARRMRPDVAFAFQGHIKNLMAARLSGAKVIHIMPSRDKLVRQLSQPMAEFEPGFPQRERYYALMRQRFEVSTVERPIMPAVSSPIDSPKQPRIVLSVATNSADRNYPTAKWAEVAQNLLSKGYEVGVIGTAGTAMPQVEGLHDWVGKHTLRETMGLIATANVHIGGDTGTGHIAAAYGVPTVVIYGPTNERQYQPEGAPSIPLRNGTNPADVAVEDVIEATHRLLQVSTPT